MVVLADGFHAFDQDGGECLPGVDLSQYQYGVDYARLRADGQRFAFLRATIGEHTDEKLTEHARGCAGAGLEAGAYHFALVDGPVKTQARRFLDAFSPFVFSLGAALDFEQTHGRGPLECSDWIEHWIELVEPTAGRITVYASPGFLRSALGALRPAWFSRVDWWIAEWGGVVELPPGVTDWRWWQFSGDGGVRVPGVPMPCDRNLFHGGDAAFAATIAARAARTV